MASISTIKKAAAFCEQRLYSKTKNYNSNNQYYYEDVPSDIFELCYNDIIKWNDELKIQNFFTTMTEHIRENDYDAT